MVDVRYSKETNYGYIIDTHSIVKSVSRKGSAKKLNLYLCQHCRCGFFFFTPVWGLFLKEAYVQAQA